MSEASAEAAGTQPAPVQVLDDVAGVPAAGQAAPASAPAPAPALAPAPASTGEGAPGARASVPALVTDRKLLVQLLWLMLPVLAEHALHILVGLTDTYLANHLHRH